MMSRQVRFGFEVHKQPVFCKPFRLTRAEEIGRKVQICLVKKSLIWRDPGSVPPVRVAARES